VAASTTTPQQVIVIGAGAVGTATAIYLQREGHRVRLVDPDTPGNATSFGNAGSLAPGSIVPLAMPGTFSHVPGWLLNPLGPLALSWRGLPGLLPWLLRFRSACTLEAATRAAAAMRSLNKDSVTDYQELLATAGAPDLVQVQGMMHVYRTESGFRGSALGRKMRTDLGCPVELLDAAQIHELEPALAPDYRWGFMLPDNAHVLSPFRTVQTLAHYFERNGGTLTRARALDIRPGPDGSHVVKTDQGEHAAQHVVLSAGVWSRELAAKLGSRVPLAAERGYHIEIPEPGVALTRPVSDGDGKFVAIPMEGGLRFAGTSEFAGLNAPPNWGRTAALARLAQSMIPGVRTEPCSRWMGHRPSTPDSIPVIGRAPGHDRIWFAFGHGHWGLMAAPATGQVIADLVAGRPPRIDITPFRPERFD